MSRLPTAKLQMCPPCPDPPGGSSDVLFFMQQVTNVLANLKVSRSKALALQKLDIILDGLKSIIGEEDVAQARAAVAARLTI